MLAPLGYHDLSVELSDTIHHGRAESTIGDRIEILVWRIDDDRSMPSMRRLDDDGAEGFQNPSNFRRKGVQVLYSADALTLMKPCEEGPAKKATRKARWPYMGKY
jgi:hypothetical protein